MNNGTVNTYSSNCQLTAEPINTGENDYAFKHGLNPYQMSNSMTVPQQPKQTSTGNPQTFVHQNTFVNQQPKQHQDVNLQPFIYQNTFVNQPSKEVPYMYLMTEQPHTMQGNNETMNETKIKKKKKSEERGKKLPKTEKKVAKISIEESSIENGVEDLFKIPQTITKPRVECRENIIGDVITIKRIISLTGTLNSCVSKLSVDVIPKKYTLEFARWVLLKCGIQDSNTAKGFYDHVFSNIHTIVQSISVSETLNTHKTDILADITGFSGMEEYNNTPCSFFVPHSRELRSCNIALGCDGNKWSSENLDKKIELAVHLSNEHRYKTPMTFTSGDGNFQYRGVRIGEDHPVYQIHRSGLFFGREETSKLGFDRNYVDLDDKNYEAVVDACRKRITALPIYKAPCISFFTQAKEQVVQDILARTNAFIDPCEHVEFMTEEFAKVGCVQLCISARVKFAVHMSVFD